MSVEKTHAMRYFLLVALTLLLATGCKKDSLNTTSQFYGHWKTSYGDTVEFRRQNGKNVIIYDATLNPSMPMRTTSEFNYQNEKLGIKNPWSSPVEFRYIDSFTWIQRGESFEVLGIDWFPFMSSTLTKFTFTKLP